MNRKRNRLPQGELWFLFDQPRNKYCAETYTEKQRDNLIIPNEIKRKKVSGKKQIRLKLILGNLNGVNVAIRKSSQ